MSTGEPAGDPAEHYHACLASGRLVFQACECGNRWLPPRSHCPRCLGARWSWQDACGRGRILSWVVYRVAYDDSVASRLPYNVAIVELEEGPRVVTNILDRPDGAGLAVGAAVRYEAVRDSGPARTAFRLAARD